MLKELRYFLTTLVLAVCATTALAVDVTVNFTAGTDKGSSTASTAPDKVEKEGVVIDCSKAALGRTDNYRFYANSTFTVSAPGNITKIVFTSMTGYQDFSLGEGATGTLTQEGDVYTWVGDEKSVAFKTTKQSRALKVEVTYTSPDADAIAAPTITPAGGTYFAPQTVTIAGQEGATLQYALGEGEFQTYTEPFLVSETTTVRAKQLVDGKESLLATVNIVIAATYTTLADLNAAASTKAPVKVVLPEAGWLVSYVNDKNAYLTDGAKAILLYNGKEAFTLKAGDRVKGEFQGEVMLYNGLPEVSVSELALQTLSEGNAVNPLVVDAAALAANFFDYANMLVTIKGAVFSQDVAIAGKRENVSFTAGGKDFVLRNNFLLNLNATAGEYILTAIAGSIYSGAQQLYPISENCFTKMVVSEAEYLIRNVENGGYLGGGNAWGTNASTLGKPQWLRLVALADGTYHLDSHQSNGGNAHFLNAAGWMDNASPVALTLTKLEDGTFTISHGTNFLTAGALGASINMTGADGTVPAAQWRLLTMADVLQAQSLATAEAPVDVTALVYNPEMKRNLNQDVEGLNKWVVKSFDGAANAQNFNWGSGGNNANLAESYHSTNGFKASQTLENLKPGVYGFSAHAFYRQDGTDNDHLPVMFANEEQTVLPLRSGTENSMVAAYASFLQGNYKTEELYVQVAEGGTLTIGFQNENTNMWNIFGELTLRYFGAEADVNALKNGALLSELAAEQQLARENVKNEVASQASITRLNEALAASESVEQTKEALTAALEALKAANAAVRLSAEQKTGIEGMKQLLASTNVYTAEAAAAYQADIDAKEAAWEAGTLEGTVQNPYGVYGWHSVNTYDDLLLSAWSINDVKAEEFATALHINTWSNEGESDGSDFKTPFYEYWIADANSLEPAVLTAKVEGVAPGVYNITADVRVRIKNGADTATGISLNGTDVCAGEQVGESQFRLLKGAQAVATVGEDGILRITFDVAADNTVSWLSFQNVKYVLDPIATGISGVERGVVRSHRFTLSGTRARKHTRGIVIENGRKVTLK